MVVYSPAKFEVNPVSTAAVTSSAPQLPVTVICHPVLVEIGPVLEEKMLIALMWLPDINRVLLLPVLLTVMTLTESLLLGVFLIAVLPLPSS